MGTGVIGGDSVVVMLSEDASASWFAETGAPPPEHLGVESRGEPPARLVPLLDLGWTVECRGCYWLARRDHRRIEVYRDGRVICKDPTITARYQFDDEWLNAMRFVWPDVQF